MEKKEAGHTDLIRGFATKAIHLSQEPDPGTGAVIAPICLSSTYAVRPGAKYIYSRFGNPNRTTIESVVGTLEHAKYALGVCSGESAGALITQLLQPGDEILACEGMYSGLVDYFEMVGTPRNGFTVKYVDFGNKEELLAGFTIKTKMVWMESPTNPMLRIYDIAEVARICHEKKALLVFDNTFLTPYLQNPLDFGVDIVMHSISKYIGGHSDLIYGMICLNDEELYQRLKKIYALFGSCPSGFDSYLALRGIKTLKLRVERAQSNALQLAQFLAAHPSVEAVFYPGLPSSQGYELNTKQARGGGPILSFRIKGVTLEQTVKFCKSLYLFSYAVSYGGVEGLVIPVGALMYTRAPPEFKKKMGITDNLVRVCPGIDDFVDIQKDFAHALENVQ